MQVHKIYSFALKLEQLIKSSMALDMPRKERQAEDVEQRHGGMYEYQHLSDIETNEASTPPLAETTALPDLVSHARFDKHYSI